MSHDSYQLPRLSHPWIALCMTIAFLHLDVRAAISLLSGNASSSTVLQANLPLAVNMIPTPFPKKTSKCFTPEWLKLSKAVLQRWRAFGQGIFKAEEENDRSYIAYGRAELE